MPLQSIAPQLKKCRETLRFGQSRRGETSIAMPYIVSPGWTAKQSLTRSIVTALRKTAEKFEGDVELLILGQKNAPTLEGVPKGLGVRMTHVAQTDWNDPARRQAFLEASGISALLNFYLPPIQTGPIGNVGWIYDFQHVVLPEFFSEEERNSRDIRFRNVAEYCNLVVLSSQDACRDFANFAPDHAGKARCNSFPSALTPADIRDPNPAAALERYRVPRKYAFVANQFWAHKNHKVVIEAVAICRKRGLEVPVVFTGLPLDHRDTSNTYVSQVLQQIAHAGVSDLVRPLGLVPYSDLLGLLRCAALILQPSRMEGWSTTIQDAKALGRPVACSNLAVLQEQAPDAVGFFPCDEPEVLADLFCRHWADLAPGPNLDREPEAMAQEARFATGYGEKLWQICREAADLAQRA